MQMLEQDLQKVLVLEDDVDFEPDFRENLREVLDEAQEFSPTWDLMYVHVGTCMGPHVRRWLYL